MENAKKALESLNSELRKTQRDLFLSKEKYFNLYDRAPVGYLSLNLQGQILEVNLAAAELFGLEKTQLHKRTFSDFIFKDDLPRLQEAQRALLNKKREQDLELRIITTQGNTIWVRIGKTLDRGEDGLPFEQVVLINIEEAKKLEEKRLEALSHAESALHELRNQKFILDQHAIVAETDIAGRITYVNDKFCSISGYSREELLGRNHRMINSGRHLKEFFAGMWAEISSGKIWQGEICNRAKDGSLYWVDSTIAPILDAAGKPKSYIAVRRDITTSKRLEADIRSSEQFSRDTLEHFPGMVAYWTSDSRFVFANQYFLSWFSKTIKEMQSRSAADLMSDIANARGEELLRSVLKGENQQFEQTFTRPDGEIRNLWTQVLGHRLEEKLVGFFVMVSDITDIKNAEAKRHESQARINLLVRSANIGLWDWDLLTQELFLSTEWKAQIGYTDEEIANNLDSWHRHIHPDDLELKINTLEDFTDGKISVYEIEYRMRHKDGSWRWILARGELVKNAKGRAVKIRGSHVDITERKRIEHEIISLNNSLEERVRERTLQLEKMQEKMIAQERMAVLGELAGSVAHELRNPLGVISNSVYFLKMFLAAGASSQVAGPSSERSERPAQKEAPEKVREYLDVIESEIRTSDKIVSDLLSFAIFSSIDRKPLSLREVLEQLLSRHPNPTGVRTILEIPAELPHLMADRQHLLQIFSNIIINAFQAMPEGGDLTISAAVSRGSLSVRFEDTGHGISPENKRKIFQPLFTTKIKGIGLGLAVCKKLVEANGGQLFFDSEIGKGTWFEIVLPLAGQGEA
ncbi:MAG: PAS domain S-box protein [Spirochaetia bacterium]|nr:PAS domain S-box protein [Spirochaetia bacterium]